MCPRSLLALTRAFVRTPGDRSPHPALSNLPRAAAAKQGRFLPTAPAERAECLSWLFWQVGSAPYLGGGFGHFYNYATVKLEYPINRFAMEAKRQLDVLDQRLASNTYLCGDDYTLADMAVWPWYGSLVLGRLYGASEFLQVKSYTHVVRWAKLLDARPAVQRGRMVNRAWGEETGQVIERHSCADFVGKFVAADGKN